MTDTPDLAPRTPHRPLLWPDIVYALQEMLADDTRPVYIVGGAVRDAFLHRPLKDIDLVTTEPAIELARRIANQFNGAFYKLDAERDVGRAILTTDTGSIEIDVARWRSASLLDDLLDRDFTINAMVVDLRGDLTQLIDPLHGEDDLRDKLIRQCAPHSVANDAIRTLRAVRLAVQLGLHIEPGTLRAVRQAAPTLCQSSPERRRDEFIKMLALRKPAAALRVAGSLGLIECVLPEAMRPVTAWTQTLTIIESLDKVLGAISYSRSDNTAASFGLGIMVMQLDRYRAELVNHIETVWPNERPHRALLMLAALLHTTPEHIPQVAENLRLSNLERTRLTQIIRDYHHPQAMDNPTPRDIHRFWRSSGAAGIDVCLLTLANTLGTAGVELDQDAWLMVVDRVRVLLSAYYDQYETLVEPPTLIDGNALMQRLGLRPGQIVGKLLDMIREAQAAGEVQTADDAVRCAQDYLNQGL
ncbi:MAG: CCA tRNA nucleotidyltransferase [Anaerolineaceae bacterium]|nr:CCA tRNA nucleotidyltransferase [Anaerolineaceae bacterium]